MSKTASASPATVNAIETLWHKLSNDLKLVNVAKKAWTRIYVNTFHYVDAYMTENPDVSQQDVFRKIGRFANASSSAVDNWYRMGAFVRENKIRPDRGKSGAIKAYLTDCRKVNTREKNHALNMIRNGEEGVAVRDYLHNTASYKNTIAAQRVERALEAEMNEEDFLREFTVFREIARKFLGEAVDVYFHDENEADPYTF